MSSPAGGDVMAPTSEMQELMTAIRTGLDSLFKTSAFIRKFASKERRSRAIETKPFDNRADIMYINDRYPLLSKNPTLAARLGEANARRRQFFKYRRDHDQRLATVATRNEPTTNKAQSSLETEKPGPPKTALTAETKPSVLAETKATTLNADADAQARMLQVAKAAEAMSTVSFATSIAATSDDELLFPPLPSEAKDGSPFLCSYCLRFEHFKREGLEYQWRCEGQDSLRDLADLLQKTRSPRS